MLHHECNPRINDAAADTRLGPYDRRAAWPAAVRIVCGPLMLDEALPLLSGVARIDPTSSSILPGVTPSNHRLYHRRSMSSRSGHA